ncbi:Ivy family c-type lysozyme inhibitor [Acinetobacter nectaris]|uniref:Ivy family c-type lysozyme inhibitor n=1 Tax=Acinetobacter nectaris TaxID=1219382 RepID=UPI001F348233|nr:Ivy family c-type lysozyme inhibitor [Acinetobacter nectaris]MCF9034424.1 hypothetical protein [Acinetobacter nectaris]
MKKLMLLTFLTTVTIATVHAAEVNSLLSDKGAQTEFKKISANKALPSWTKYEATSSPTKTVTIAGKQYSVFNACKPHNCFAEQVAVIYSPSSKAISSVYSKFDDKKGTEQLTWMTNQPEISIEQKTVLLASITGALENYPKKFNF